MKTEKKSFFNIPAVQTILASVLCIVLGLLVGYIVLLAINSKGANEAIVTLLKNYLIYPSTPAKMKYLGNTLVKTAPLLMCALSIQFCYKTGLFNIGAAGQYVAGAGACLFCALQLKLPWIACLIAAAVAGALFGSVVGLLKAYANVNEVISGIILTLVIGGALAGIGAAFLYLTGYEQWSVTQTSVPGMGFNGIAATFLGGLHPIGTIFSSYFIQHITSGGAFLDKNVYPSQISDLISAVIIYLCGLVLFFKLFLNKRHSSKKGGTSK